MRLYFPVDSTGNLIMIEKLVLGEIWTGDLPIFNPDELTSAPSRQATYIDSGHKFGTESLTQSTVCHGIGHWHSLSWNGALTQSWQEITNGHS